jgi:hypothetical protein
MAVNYTTAVKQSRMAAVVTAIGAAGLLKLFAADGTTLLATFTLAATAGDTSTTPGVLILNDQNGATTGILNTTASAAGTATLAKIQTSASADIITGLTVGTSGTDLVLDNNVLANGQAITITTGTITHA